jgi:hypothetical protein
VILGRAVAVNHFLDCDSGELELNLYTSAV